MLRLSHIVAVRVALSFRRDMCWTGVRSIALGFDVPVESDPRDALSCLSARVALDCRSEAALACVGSSKCFVQCSRYVLPTLGGAARRRSRTIQCQSAGRHPSSLLRAYVGTVVGCDVQQRFAREPCCGMFGWCTLTVSCRCSCSPLVVLDVSFFHARYFEAMHHSQLTWPCTDCSCHHWLLAACEMLCSVVETCDPCMGIRSLNCYTPSCHFTSTSGSSCSAAEASWVKSLLTNAVSRLFGVPLNFTITRS